MGDIIRNDATARTAVLDQIEDNFSKPSDGEQSALRDALGRLSILRQIAERDIAH